MTRQTNTATPPNEPWAQPWPAEDLETVGHCPVCGAASRKLLHADLVDNAFRTAPGKWALWTCAKCRSAYLDPRPSRDSIYRAYANYYTHQAPAGKNEYADLGLLRKLRRRLVNGYTNWRFGTQALPSSSLGSLLVHAMPKVKRVLEREYRHLPKRQEGGGHLLDVGCGDGSFLRIARTCGWKVVGLEPDLHAVANAVKLGLTVHAGGIEYFDGQTKLFDVITLNHVIEHVHEPQAVLKRCYSLLKPGGQLWIETPNIDSFGHTQFQKDWRGLETPRHLILFNHRSLWEALRKTGFIEIHDLNCQSACQGMFRASAAMQRGYSPYGQGLINSHSTKIQASVTAFAGMFAPSRREFLTIAALKAAV